MNRFFAMSLIVPFACAAATWAADVTLDGLKSKTPDTWKTQEPSNKMRAYQFALPKAKDDDADGELVISFFGAGSGGKLADNLSRWKTMIQPPEGKTADDISKITKIELPKAKLTCLDMTGTFLSKFPPFDPNAKVTKKPNYRRIGVYFDCDNGPYFITLVGPAATIEQHKEGFDNWLKNFK